MRKISRKKAQLFSIQEKLNTNHIDQEAKLEVKPSIKQEELNTLVVQEGQVLVKRKSMKLQDYHIMECHNPSDTTH